MVSKSSKKTFRFFCGFIIMLQIYAFQATAKTENQETSDKDTQEPIDWTGLLTDLRGSWQSPISYLQKRGYLPPGNENLLEEKLNELRGDAVVELSENIEKGGASKAAAAPNTNAQMGKLNAKPQVASEITDTSVSNLAESEVASAANPTATFTAHNILGSVEELMAMKNEPNAHFETNSNEDEPLATYASQEQLSNELQEDLFKGLGIDLNADTDKETEQETEEGADNAENDIANVKSSSSKQLKSKKKKKKCKAKTKSKSKTSQAKPGFFQKLKQKFSSMFRKADKVAEPKKTPQNKKLALSPDFASYYVRYLAHRDHDNHDTNSLSVSDLAGGQYTSARYYGDPEMGDGGKGLYRRDYSGKDLTLKDYKIADTPVSATNEKNMESNDLKTTLAEKEVETGSKDFTLREFPFKDFNLGDIDMKKLQTNAMKSDSHADVKVADLKNFDSKDEELNAIVHSLAEQKPAEMKSIKSTMKDDFTLKALTPNKDAGDDALDDSASLMARDFDFKKYTPTFERGTNIASHVGKDTDTAAISKDLSIKDDYLGDSDQQLSYDVKNSYGDVIKHINLKDFDFNLPDLGLKGLKTKSNQYIPSMKQFGNLGVPSAKLKALEADAAATSRLQSARDSNESSLNGLGVKIRDFGVSDALKKETAYMRRELDATNNVAADNQSKDDDEVEEEDDEVSGDEKSHVAVKETHSNDFDLRSLSTSCDDSNLELDRQFTRQVLEKVMRDAAQNNEHVKE